MIDTNGIDILTIFLPIYRKISNYFLNTLGENAPLGSSPTMSLFLTLADTANKYINNFKKIFPSYKVDKTLAVLQVKHH